MLTTKTFDLLVAAQTKKPRYTLLCGGTRSGKTYAVLQWLLLLALTKRNKIITIISQTYPHLRRGAIRDIQDIAEGEGLPFSLWWNKTTSTLLLPTNSQMEFYSADAPAKVHGPGRDVLFINEAQTISYETARQLFVRTRDNIIIDYNPIRRFWAMEKIQGRKGAECFKTTYKDNDLLTDEQVAEIEANKDDPVWWRVYGEGETGQLTGVIYSYKITPELPKHLPVIAGLDFGFTHDPTAAVLIAADTARKFLYMKEIIYTTGSLLRNTAEMLLSNIPKGTPVYCDSAEPRSIQELRTYGVAARPANKGGAQHEKLLHQIQYMQGWHFFVTPESGNLIDELEHYTWDTDMDGNETGRPIDKYNHALDALRYAVWTHHAGRNTGVYNFR